jgi:hypothetical protein
VKKIDIGILCGIAGVFLGTVSIFEILLSIFNIISLEYRNLIQDTMLRTLASMFISGFISSFILAITAGVLLLISRKYEKTNSLEDSKFINSINPLKFFYFKEMKSTIAAFIIIVWSTQKILTLLILESGNIYFIITGHYRPQLVTELLYSIVPPFVINVLEILFSVFLLLKGKVDKKNEVIVLEDAN